ncbi:MAG: efflux RND transporter periplasmic adaptor subunit [Sulfurimicrobium sp.]|nr:efflux RND transporter periplasmic adaptor subunit [Sulfurimicrobium sp.]MDZ7654576.1 efflux RND transporter periplasmic adaptor subunit [Sulfurimicrobium sp.]
MQAISIPLLILLSLSGCTKAVEQPEQIRPALVYTVAEHAGGQTGAYSGEVHARREAELGFRVGGKVAARLVEPGDTVKPGQVLGQLDLRDAQLAVGEASAQLAAAKSEASTAAAELARAQKLVAQKFLSQAALDARVNAHDTAQARLAAARAQLDLATSQSNHTALTASSAGVVTYINFEAGQVVSAGQPVVRVAYAGEKEAHIRVGEAQAQQLKPGAPVQIRLWSAPQKVYAGTVREAAPAADENRTYLVKATIHQADDVIRLGMTASVAFSRQAAGAPAISLPPGALIQQGKQTSVWRVDAQQQVSAVPVEVVQFADDGLLVRGDLPIGSRVIAAGAHKLHPGQKIKPMPYESFSPAAGGSSK